MLLTWSVTICQISAMEHNNNDHRGMNFGNSAAFAHSPSALTTFPPSPRPTSIYVHTRQTQKEQIKARTASENSDSAITFKFHWLKSILAAALAFHWGCAASALTHTHYMADSIKALWRKKSAKQILGSRTRPHIASALMLARIQRPCIKHYVCTPNRS